MWKRLGLAATLLVAGLGVALAQVVTPAGNPNPGTVGVKVLSAANKNCQSVRVGQMALYQVTAINTTVTPWFLKLYDLNRSPNTASDVSIQSLPVPANTQGSGFSVSYPEGIGLLNGLAMCMTGAIADTDETNAATGVAINFNLR